MAAASHPMWRESAPEEAGIGGRALALIALRQDAPATEARQRADAASPNRVPLRRAPAAPASADAASADVRATCALVLAGGRGTRLKPLTDACAKPAIPFGGNLRLIDFTLANCINSGIRRIGVLTQYQSPGLVRHIAQRWSPRATGPGEFVAAVASRLQGVAGGYRGTADAVFQNLALLRDAGARYVLVLAGDHVYKMDYRRLIAEHVERGADVTVACVEVPLAQARGFGVMSVDEDDRVRGFEEKPARPSAIPGQPDVALASMGVYVFGAAFLADALDRDAQATGSAHDFGQDILPGLVPRARVYAHRYARSCVGAAGAAPYWRDVGTLDAYWQAHMDLVRARPELELDDPAWPIRTHAGPLPPARFVTGEDGRCTLAVDALIAGGCVVEGATVRRSVLSANVHIGAGSVVDESLLLPGVVLGRHVTLRRVIVDAGCVLPDGLTIGIDPDADRARYTVTDGGVTLVTAAMLAPGARAGD